MGKNRKEKISREEEQLIIEQLKCLHSELVSIQQAFLGYISIPLGIYVLAIYYALENTDSSGIIFSMLPFLFLLSVFNIVKYTIKMLGIDAYMAYLEKMINLEHEKALFLWQGYLIYANGYSIVGGLCQIPVFLAIAIFLFGEFRTAVGQLNVLFPHANRVFIFLLIMQCVFLIFAIVICMFQYHIVLKWCDKIPFKMNRKNCKIMETIHTRVPFIFNRSFWNL